MARLTLLCVLLAAPAGAVIEQCPPPWWPHGVGPSWLELDRVIGPNYHATQPQKVACYSATLTAWVQWDPANMNWPVVVNPPPYWIQGGNTNSHTYWDTPLQFGNGDFYWRSKTNDYLINTGDYIGTSMTTTDGVYFTQTTFNQLYLHPSGYWLRGYTYVTNQWYSVPLGYGTGVNWSVVYQSYPPHGSDNNGAGGSNGGGADTGGGTSGGNSGQNMTDWITAIKNMLSEIWKPNWDYETSQGAGYTAKGGVQNLGNYTTNYWTRPMDNQVGLDTGIYYGCNLNDYLSNPGGMHSNTVQWQFFPWRNNFLYPIMWTFGALICVLTPIVFAFKRTTPRPTI